jgi:protein O-mannosyl-transferase
MSGGQQHAFAVCAVMSKARNETKRQKTKPSVGANQADIACPIGKTPNAIPALALILFATIIVYLPVFKNSANWDDDKYIVNNPVIRELSPSNIVNMFRGERSYFLGNYHPLTILSLAIDYKISNSGNEKIPHLWMFQFTNLFLHALNTVLVFYLVLAIFRHLKNSYAIQIALLAALIFGVHTLHVESVVWISERKDVLFAAFFLASLVSYIKYLSKDKYFWLGLSFLFFIFSLLSKGQAVSLAFTILAVDYVWGRKLLSPKVFIEKLPYFIAAAVFGFIAIKAQSAGDAILDISDYRFYERVLFASYGFTMYLLKLILPIRLSAYYPYQYTSGNVPAIYFAFLLVAGSVIYLFFHCLHRRKEISFGIAIFVLNIALLLQLIPVGSAVMADRYAYIPSIGFFLLAAVLYGKIAEKSKTHRRMANGVVAAYVLALMVLTFSRVQVWKDGLTLWADATSKEPMGAVAWNNLGNANINAGNLDEAVRNFDIALGINNGFSMAWFNRGTAEKKRGDTNKDSDHWKRALNDYDKAVQLQPVFPEAYFSRGLVRDLLGDVKGEIDDFKTAIDQNIENPQAYINYGVALGKAGRLDDAIIQFDKAISKNARYAEAYENRGTAEFQQAKYKEAVKDYNKAIDIDPNLNEAFYNRGLAKNQLAEYEQAIEDFNTILARIPSHSDAYLNRGVSYKELHRYQEALRDFDRATKAPETGGNAFYQEYLIFRTLNQKEQACQSLREAVQMGANLNPDDQTYCRPK